MMLRTIRSVVVGLLLLASSVLAQTNNAVTTGEFIVEPATIHNLGFEWKISGDDNRNATVAVQYRKAGETAWREALPLLRIGDEKVWRAREFLEYWTPRMFAGSILDVEEATTYECRFTMSDPDGVSGKATQQVTVKTRGVPQEYKGGRTLHVYPPDYEGPKQEPSFKGLERSVLRPRPRRLGRCAYAPCATRRCDSGTRGIVQSRPAGLRHALRNSV